MVNWKLISHPLNWAIVLSMILVAALFGHYALEFFGVEPCTSKMAVPTNGAAQTTAILNPDFATPNNMASLPGGR